jgi:TolB-like protein
MLVNIDVGRQHDSFDAAVLKTHTERVLSSRTFRRASRLRDLLAYVVSNALAGSLTLEHTTAKELYGRGDEFNPAIDPSIRVQFGRLRRLLLRYSEAEGKSDEFVLEIPSGSYTPVFKKKGSESNLPAAKHAQDTIPNPKPGSQPRAIAVLPFTNLTNDPKQDTFCDGVTEEIVTALVQTPTVDVVASASGLQFKDESADIRAVARELGVAFVLAGSVRKEGGHTRVTAQLARAEDGVAIWSDTVDTHTKSTLTTQRQIAQRVIQHLPVSS